MSRFLSPVLRSALGGIDISSPWPEWGGGNTVPLGGIDL